MVQIAEPEKTGELTGNQEAKEKCVPKQELITLPRATERLKAISTDPFLIQATPPCALTHSSSFFFNLWLLTIHTNHLTHLSGYFNSYH